MKNNFFKIILIIIMLFCIGLISFNNLDVIKADSGWDSDYDSSWDSGSDWGSSSWDNDYDYDDDYDYYDDNNSNTGGSSLNLSFCKSETCKNVVQIITYIIMFIIMGVIGCLFALAIIIRIFQIIIGIIKFIIPNKKKNKQLSIKKNYIKLDQKYVDEIIPDLNIEEFNFKAYQIFYDVQIAWMNFDYDKLKELVTDELYNTYVMDLEVLKTKKQKNTMKGFELINSYIFDLKDENGNFSAKVYLNVKFYDYIEDSNTGKVLRGTQDRKLNNTYILTFIKTKEETSNINYCPRCSAPVEGNHSGICEYCKSKLINETHDWVMSKKEKISQK